VPPPHRGQSVSVKMPLWEFLVIVVLRPWKTLDIAATRAAVVVASRTEEGRQGSRPGPGLPGSQATSHEPRARSQAPGARRFSEVKFRDRVG
jgi:hypothetical protein